MGQKVFFVFYSISLSWMLSCLSKMSLTSTCSTPQPLSSCPQCRSARLSLRARFSHLCRLSPTVSLFSGWFPHISSSDWSTLSGARSHLQLSGLQVFQLLSPDSVSTQWNVATPAIKSSWFTCDVICDVTGPLGHWRASDWSLQPRARWLVEMAAIVSIGLVFLCCVGQKSVASL